MSLKAELETWAAALKAYDEEDFDKSLDLFSRIADSSKILTNMGLIYATLGEHELAVEQFNAATNLDQYLAVAYFQCGISNFLLGRYELSLKDFEEALLYLRGNQAINYEQLGLKFKLFSAEVLFNKGLSLLYMGSVEEGMRDLLDAQKEKATEEHKVIDDAINDRGEGYTVFSIPVGVLYRPSENKLKNAKAKDYLGKARLVAAADTSDAYTTFTGVTRLRQGITPSGTRIERPNSDPTPTNNIDISPPMANPTERLNVISRDEIGNARNQDRNIGGNGLGRAGTMRNTTGPGATRAGTIRRNASTGSAVGGGRRAGTPPGQDTSGPPPPAPPKPSGGGGPGPTSRLTEIYDDYINNYTEDAPPIPAAPEQSKRIQAWARGANAANTSPIGNSPVTAPPGAFRQPSVTRAPSTIYSGGSMRRRVTRRPTYNGSMRGGGSRAQSAYDEEEEGYVSGEYEEGEYELSKIRVKIHYNDDIRGMALDPQVTYDEFVDKVCRKFDKAFDGLLIKFKDEDGGKVSMRDESDYDLAIETARESAKGRPEGKLELWCDDR